MKRGLRLVLTTLALLLAAIAALPFALDTAPGRAWLADRIAGLRLESGLGVRVARIDGSLWGKARLRGVDLLDPQGRFARIDALDLDWRPLALAANRFEAQALLANRLRLDRLPALRPTRDPRLLPAFDIRINQLAIARIEVAAGLAGPERLARARGRIDIAAGRALVQLDADAPGAADRLHIDLDAQPDRDRFALVARLQAPPGGLVAGLTGLQRGLAFDASGRGRWRAWTGRLAARIGAAAVADAALAGQDGVFSATGRIDPATLLARGPAASLLNGGLAITLRARPRDGAVQITGTATGRWLNGRIAGRVDRASERIEDGDLSLSLADGAPLPPGAVPRGLVVTARLAGPWLAPMVDARAVATTVALAGGILLDRPTLTAIIDANERPVAGAVAITLAGVRGLPPSLAPLAGRWQANGTLRWQGGEVKGDGLLLQSGPLAARLGLVVAPARGSWAARLAAEVRGWALPLLGGTDASLRLDLQSGLVGSGSVQLNAARPPASALSRFTGGAIALSGRIALLPGLAVEASGLALSSPGLAASGRAGWRSGSLSLGLSGRSGDFGAFTLSGGGPLAGLDLALGLPAPGYGLNSVAAHIVNRDGRWQVKATAGSVAGPVELAAGITAEPVLKLAIDRLAVAGFTARGTAEQTAAGPLAGTLDVAGPGLSGTARLFGEGAVQQAQVNLAGDTMAIAQDTPISIDRLRLAARISLPPDGPRIDANAELKGLERGNLVVEAADATLKLVDGRGDARLVLAGDSGAPFRLQLAAAITPGRYQLSGDGSYDGRRAQLAGPATLSLDEAGWHLSATRITSGLGNAELAGDWGRQRRLQARLDQVSLALIGLAYPSINLAGKVSGDISLAQTPGENPQGRASLRLIGLSRSNITSTSTPIDMGLNAALGGDGTVVRAVIMRAGKVEGRAQARLGPVASGRDSWATALAAAPITGQLRYAGPAQDLWGLSGLTALDLRGAVQVAADLAGTLGDPQIAGRIIARDTRVEAPLLGAVATGASLDARFTASRLELTRFAGTSGQGSITGSGSIDLSFERGFPMDIRMAVKDAAILGRDDVIAVGSGNIRVATDEYGGVVSGTLRLARGEYRVGRTAVADVPVLAVTEKNTRRLGRRVVQYVPPTRWLYNLAITAERQLMVTGMGIKSEWDANVRLRGAANAPELFGRVSLVRGDYDFAGKRFQLTRGDIRFQGGYPPDPIINVAAENASSGFTAQLSIEGTAQRPQIRFSSVPALPEDEVLSRVLFGARVTDLSAPEAIQLAGALSSLRGGGFNPIGAVSKGLGIDRLRILPADITTGRKTAVAAGQYLGRNVYVELATDAQGYTATSIEIGLTRSLSILSSVATLGGTSVGVRWTKDY